MLDMYPVSQLLTQRTYPFDTSRLSTGSALTARHISKKARHEVGLLTIESRFSMVFIFVFVLMFVFTARAVPVAIVAQIVADRATRGAA